MCGSRRPPDCSAACCSIHSGAGAGRKRRDERRVNAEVGIDSRRLDCDRLERAFPADAARRGRVEAAREARRIESVRVELDGVGGEVVREPSGRGPKPLRERETQGELLVVARRAHRHGDGAAADSDLERLLDGDDVAGVAVGDPNDVDACGAVGRRAHRPSIA